MKEAVRWDRLFRFEGLVARERPLVGLLDLVQVSTCLQCLERVLSGEESVVGGVVERHFDDVVAFGTALDVDRAVQELVESSSVLVVGAHVQVGGVHEELELLVDRSVARCEVDVDVRELLEDAVAFGLDLVDLGSDLLHGESSARGQLDEVLLTCVEFVALLFELLLQEALGATWSSTASAMTERTMATNSGGDAPLAVVAFDGTLDLEQVVVGVGCSRTSVGRGRRSRSTRRRSCRRRVGRPAAG